MRHLLSLNAAAPEPDLQSKAASQEAPHLPRSSSSHGANKWAAPQLSQLVDRLGSQNAAAAGAQGHPPSAPQRRSRLGVLAPAQAPSHGDEAAGRQLGSSYIAAAAPAHWLLHCLGQQPRSVLTAEPLPFANAESPLVREEPDLDAASSMDADEAASQQGSGATAGGRCRRGGGRQGGAGEGRGRLSGPGEAHGTAAGAGQARQALARAAALLEDCRAGRCHHPGPHRRPRRGGHL